MKPKKLSKKLALKKTTISNLKTKEMRGVEGGVTGTWPCGSCTCLTACYDTCRIGCSVRVAC